MKRRQIAWILILIVDVAYVAWGAMAAAMPDGLAGPGGKAILPAGYEGYSGGSWSELLRTSPMTAKYMIVLFRTYGMHCVAFGLLGSVIAVTAFRRGERWAWWALLVGNTLALVSAMRYDWIVNAIGPFERLADTSRAAAPAAGPSQMCRHYNSWFQAALPRILNSCDPTATNHPAKDNSQTRVSTGPIAQG